MILYLLDGVGVFDTECIMLPATVSVIPAPKTLALDGVPIACAGGRIQIPPLSEGKHLLMADGRAIMFRVQSGKFCAEFDSKALLPTVARLCHLEKKVDELEKKISANEVNWLK